MQQTKKLYRLKKVFLEHKICLFLLFDNDYKKKYNLQIKTSHILFSKWNQIWKIIPMRLMKRSYKSHFFMAKYLILVCSFSSKEKLFSLNVWFNKMRTNNFQVNQYYYWWDKKNFEYFYIQNNKVIKNLNFEVENI